MNQAALFDGSSDWLNTTLTLDTAQGGGMMAWVRPTTLGDTTRTALSTGGWAIVREGLRWKVLNGSTLVDTGAAVTPNAWQHVATTLTGNQVKFYLNGELITTVTANPWPAQPVAVGRHPAGGSYWAGNIDDVRVFTLPPSDAGVQTIYREAPIVHLHLDEASGATQFANITGAFSGACTACPTAGVDGQAGQAVEFNMTPGHTTDRIMIAADANLNLPHLSVGAWVQPAAIRNSEQVLINKGGADTGYNYNLSIPAGGLTATLTLAPVSGSACGAAVAVASKVQLLPNQWNYVMGTYDGSTARIYVNGYEQGSVADGYAGVRLINIADVTNPLPHATYNTPGYASKVGAMDRYLIVADSSGGLRVLDTLTLGGQSTVCDLFSNCTMVEPVVVSAPLGGAPAALEVQADPRNAILNAQSSLSVSILDAPPVLDSLEPLTITGEASAEMASLQALDEVTRTLWSAVWDPSALDDGPYTLQADVTGWAGDVATTTLSVIVDTTAPELSITPLITSANFHAPGMLDLTGLITDAGGIKGLEVTVAGETLPGTVAEGVWRTAWALGGRALFDGDVLTITAEALDVGGHTTLVTGTVVVDLLPPAPVALTMMSGGVVITPGLTLRSLAPTLELAWTASSDSSGLAPYRVETLTYTLTYRNLGDGHRARRVGGRASLLHPAPERRQRATNLTARRSRTGPGRASLLYRHD